MADVECIEAYRQAQRHRKAKIKVGKERVVGCI